MPPLNLLIKPASSNCNLRCKYCFYHSLAESRNTKSYGIMTLDTLEIMVKKALDYSDNVCTFAFQGGEPTLAGLVFYKKLIEFQKKYNTKNTRIANVIQTNGIIIDDEWAKFLSENNFLVGLSLDGPKDTHDQQRIDPNGKGSFMRIMKTVDLFDKYKVDYNVLAVVSGYSAKHANKIYNFFKKHDFKFLQFIPCLDPLEEVQGGNKYSLTPDKYTIFLKSLFDQWYSDIIKGNMISIRYFDNLVAMLMGYRAETCGMVGQCQIQFVIEADGSTYPCDFYVVDEWGLGNIKQMGFDEMKGSDTAKRFLETSKYVDPKCSTCKWRGLCRGGCRRYREPYLEGRPILNYYCSSYEEFFEYAYERMQKIAHMLIRRS